MKKKIFSSLILALLFCSVLAGLFQPLAWGSNISFVACRGIDKSQKRWAPIDVTNSLARILLQPQMKESTSSLT